MRSVLKLIFSLSFFLAIFSFWDMVNFVFNIRSELVTLTFDIELLQTWFRNVNQLYPITSWLVIGAERREAPHETGVQGGGTPLT